MLFKCRCQLKGQRSGQQVLRHIGRDQDQGPVAAILTPAALPRDP
jgi:hypothetical protein